MRTVKTLRPGQKGTKELQKRSGPSLLLVRYRYDEERREHVKTVELVVQRWPREGEAEVVGSRSPGARMPGARSAGAGVPFHAQWRASGRSVSVGLAGVRGVD